MDPLLFSRIHSKFTICSTNSLWILNILSKSTMNSLSLSRFDFEFTFFEFTFFWIHFLLHYEFFLFRDLIPYKFPNCSWVHYLFRELTMNWLSFSRIHYGLTILFEIWLWIHYQIINSTINSLSLLSIHGEFTIFSQIRYEFDYEFTIKFLIWLWIHYLFREFTIKILSLSRFDIDFSFFFVDLQCNSNLSH